MMWPCFFHSKLCFNGDIYGRNVAYVLLQMQSNLYISGIRTHIHELVDPMILILI